MKTTKSFINAVNADLAKSNVQYSSMWKVAEMLEFAGKPCKTYAAMVYVCKLNGEVVFRIYYNFDSSMGGRVNYTTRKTSKEAVEEFVNTFV